MKQKSPLSFLLAMGLLSLSSCVTITTTVTDNPVGSKTGIAKRSLIGNKDFSYEAAAKNGNITKIGTAEVKTTYFIFPFVKTTVTGE